MRRAVWLIAAVLVSAAGCTGEEGPDVRRYCTLQQECGCTQYQDVDACRSSLEEEARMLREVAQDLGLHFDEACFQANYDWLVDHYACKSEIEAMVTSRPPTGCELCDVFHGDSPEGTECFQFPEGSKCAAGLRCSNGICRDLCTLHAPGEKCRFLATNGDTYTRPCMDGFCDTTVGVCVGLLADDAACSEPSQCLSGSCRSPGVCGLPQTGDACVEDRECGWAHCVDGACAPWPGDGEACAPNGVCTLGAMCTAGDSGPICVAEPARICSAP